MRKIKIKEEQYNQLLQEAKSVGTLYHFTKLKSASNIVLKNFLVAGDAPNILRKYNQKQNFSKSISFTRDKNFLNTRLKIGRRPMIGGDEVAFVVDGDMLSNYYRLMAYDDRLLDDTYSMNVMGDEMEEVLYGKKLDLDGGIKDFKKFVKKIIINDTVITENKDELVKYVKDFFISHSGYEVEFKSKELNDKLHKSSNEKSPNEEHGNILGWLKIFKIKEYIIRDGNEVDVYQDVDIYQDVNVFSNVKKELPIKFRKIYGDFNLFGEFTSLKNCPEIVEGTFSCEHNALQSLEFAPKEVGGDFICGHNPKKFTAKDVRSVSKVAGEIIVD